MDNEEYLKSLCLKRMKELGLEGNKEYLDRFEYEMDIISRGELCDYFLIVREMINWSKSQDIMVGIGRGSSSGSLVCFLLGIVGINPLQFGLVFERFLNPARVFSKNRSLPDVDTDIESSRRDEVLKHLEKKYGKDRTARIKTFFEFKPRILLRDLGRVLDIPISEINVLSKQIPDNLSDWDECCELPNVQDFLKKYPMVKELAPRILGGLRQNGVHAAGLVIFPDRLDNFIASEKVKGKICTCFDMEDLDELGYVKLDCLSLKTLDVMAKTLELIKETTGKKVELPTTFNDTKVYELFQKGQTLGLFQYETPLLTGLAKELQIKDFETLYATTSIARPGSKNSGSTDRYIKRYLGKQKTKYLHPLMEKITSETYGEIVFQEQIIFICNEMAQMTLEESDLVRKAVAKSKGLEAIDKYKEKFISGCTSNGIKEEISNKIWEIIRQSGKYSFNKAHAVAYSAISYQTAWLKTYYPREFLCSLIQFEEDEVQIQAIRELRELGYDVKGPDINESKEHINISEDILMGLADVTNVGDKAQKEIIKNRPYTSFDDFLQKVEKRKVNSRVVKNLIMAGAFDKFDRRDKLYYSIATDEEPKEWSEEETVRRQMAILDLPSEKPLIDYYENPLEKKIDITPLSEIDFTSSNDEIWVRGIASDVKVRKSTPKVKNVLMEAQEMAFFSIDDGTKSIPSFVPPEQYMFYNELVEDGEPLVMKCHTYKKEKLYVDGIINLNKYCEDDPIVDYALFGSGNKNMISTISYHVSKKGNAFARINFGDGQMGLLFQLPDQYLRVGQELDWTYSKEPFIKVKVR